jgi:acyl dehydratase
MHGRWLEEFQVGDRYRHEPGRTVTATDAALLRWVLAPGRGPLSREEAAEGEAPLWLAFSLCIGMAGRDVSARALGNLWFRDVAYHRPLRVGETLRAESEVLAVEERSDGRTGLVTVESRLLDEDGGLVLSLRRCCVIPRREPVAAGG